jgi:hypothetical protein
MYKVVTASKSFETGKIKRKKHFLIQNEKRKKVFGFDRTIHNMEWRSLNFYFI